jgi:hypothetical protein
MVGETKVFRGEKLFGNAMQIAKHRGVVENGVSVGVVGAQVLFGQEFLGNLSGFVVAGGDAGDDVEGVEYCEGFRSKVHAVSLHAVRVGAWGRPAISICGISFFRWATVWVLPCAPSREVLRTRILGWRIGVAG